MEYKLTNLNTEQIQKLIGTNDANLKLLSNLYQTDIVYRNDNLNFLSDNNELFIKFSKHIDSLISHLDQIDSNMINLLFIDNQNSDFFNQVIAYGLSGKPYKCKTNNQYLFLNAVKNNDIVFSIGPAGTGKTFLSVLLAINYLKQGSINKIIITRPAVEAGESLGFLPGDLKDKIDPYLMPIYDSLDIVLGKEKRENYIEKGIIEVMPLAYMRGRTLDNAFIILDEAQNTTDKQMLMFLTRLGFNSKMVINGDITQIDLNISKYHSGLVSSIDRLKDIKSIEFVMFNNNDVVRNPLVSKIIERYSND